MIILFDKREKCCCCGACMNICPTKAITIKEDADGFTFPDIDYDLCIECGLCNKVCAFQNKPVTDNGPLATYAAINKNSDVLLTSTSGGVFGALASMVFDYNGVVFGCAYNDNMEPEHTCIDNKMNLNKLQGSKYVQSNINFTYKEAKSFLNDGRLVLFTGTPCQIAGLKSYLGKEYDNLITVDLICHGVPSIAFFNGYIQYLEYKLNGKIVDFKFRDKSKGWGKRGKVIYSKKGKVINKRILPIESYYYSYFLDGEIFRENCYKCKYACESREGDFTMGDYWGVDKCHPKIKAKNGVSLLLVNSEKGSLIVDKLKKHLDLIETSFEKARVHNGQLNNPSSFSARREAILRLWHEGGYKAVADEYYKQNNRQIVLFK